MVHHPVVTDVRSLLWVTNQNTITQHVWASRVPDLNYPDLCVFDLDPSMDDAGGGAGGSDRPARPARGARPAVLGQDHRLEGLPHRRAARRQDDDRRRWRALPSRRHAASSSLAPDQLTQEFSKADRGGRIYIDTGSNGYSATFAAPTRCARSRGAPVSAPCTWEELERGNVESGSFTLRNMPARIAKVGDLWDDLHRRGRSLQKAMDTLKALFPSRTLPVVLAALVLTGACGQAARAPTPVAQRAPTRTASRPVAQAGNPSLRRGIGPRAWGPPAPRLSLACAPDFVYRDGLLHKAACARARPRGHPTPVAQRAPDAPASRPVAQAGNPSLRRGIGPRAWGPPAPRLSLACAPDFVYRDGLLHKAACARARPRRLVIAAARWSAIFPEL